MSVNFAVVLMACRLYLLDYVTYRNAFGSESAISKRKVDVLIVSPLLQTRTKSRFKNALFDSYEVQNSQTLIMVPCTYHEGVWENGRIAPHILDFDTRYL